MKQLVNHLRGLHIAMLPNLSEMTVSTGDSEKASDREWMANVLQEHDDYLVVPMFMKTLTCVVRYGDKMLVSPTIPQMLGPVVTVHATDFMLKAS